MVEYESCVFFGYATNFPCVSNKLKTHCIFFNDAIAGVLGVAVLFLGGDGGDDDDDDGNDDVDARG